MPIDCSGDLGVIKTCQLALFGGIVLANEGICADVPQDASPKTIGIQVASSDDLLEVDEEALKSRRNCKKNLAAAKAAKRDEFYTQYEDIERELNLYFKYNPNVFRGKVVFLPCDNPRKSNFNRYFLNNFRRFGVKRLVCSCYNARGRGVLFVCDGSDDSVENTSLKDLKCVELQGDGDFRSEEIRNLCAEADVIVTNPPFSLFRDFFSWVLSSGKHFLVIGNVNCISYKEVYPHIMSGNVWLGHGIGRWISGFIVPDDYELYGTETRIDAEGNHVIASNGCLWLTNIDHGRRHRPLQLMTKDENIQRSKHRDVRSRGYAKYDNCDAIEVPHTDAIPSDYKGLMGVPITFLDKYCPEQFELVRFRKGDDGKDLTINGKPTYFRILIRAREY